MHEKNQNTCNIIFLWKNLDFFREGGERVYKFSLHPNVCLVLPMGESLSQSYYTGIIPLFEWYIIPRRFGTFQMNKRPLPFVEKTNVVFTHVAIYCLIDSKITMNKQHTFITSEIASCKQHSIQTRAIYHQVCVHRIFIIWLLFRFYFTVV